ncbi:MAG: hypothetical protein L6M37_01850 [Candidatus Methylarchaceae archaeon HK02M1]|nr:hypothetical protein [Candidatus Methylarchaceae archaeon HK01M]MCP8311680.1 hypothetical protein [Candidatus Methylarchaceae archaeon HK02M1]
MKFIKLDDRTSSLILGIKGVYIANPKEFLGKLREKFSSLHVQALDANFVAGFEHLKSILQQSWMAFNRGISYSKKLDLELIVRVVCDSQINRALKTVGLRSGTMDLVLVAIGDLKNLRFFAEAIMDLGEISDSVLKLTPKKEAFLIKYHCISLNLVKATVADKNRLAMILSEKANLLRV